MKAKAAKNKGRRFENYIAEQIRQAGLGEAHREVGSGSGLRKGDIYTTLPFMLECKNHNQYAFSSWIKQTKRETEQGNFDRDKWILIVRDPETPETSPNVYAMLDFWQLLNLLKRNEEPKIKEPDKELRWRLTTLKSAINNVLKEL